VTLTAGPADYYLARVSIEEQTERVEDRFDGIASVIAAPRARLPTAKDGEDRGSLVDALVGHAYVDVSSPADAGSVPAPREVVVRFTENVELEFSAVVVKSRTGEVGWNPGWFDRGLAGAPEPVRLLVLLPVRLAHNSP
jgi:hypothetical protein